MSAPSPAHGADAKPAEETPTRDAVPVAEINAPKSRDAPDKPSEVDPVKLRTSIDFLFTGCGAGQVDESVVTVKDDWRSMVDEYELDDAIFFVDTQWPIYETHSRNSHLLPIVVRKKSANIKYLLLTSEMSYLKSGLDTFQYASFASKETGRAFYDILTHPQRGSVDEMQYKDMSMLNTAFCEELGVQTLPLAADYVFTSSKQIDFYILKLPKFPEKKFITANFAYYIRTTSAYPQVNNVFREFLYSDAKGRDVCSNVYLLQKVSTQLTSTVADFANFTSREKRKRDADFVRGATIASEMHTALRRADQHGRQDSSSVSDFLPLRAVRYEVAVPLGAAASELCVRFDELARGPDKLVNDAIKLNGLPEFDVHHLLLACDGPMVSVPDGMVPTGGAVIGMPFGHLADILSGRGVGEREVASLLERLMLLVGARSTNDVQTHLMGLATRPIHAEQDVQQTEPHRRVAVGLCAAAIAFLKLSDCWKFSKERVCSKSPLAYAQTMLVMVTDLLSKLCKAYNGPCAWIKLALETEFRTAFRGSRAADRLQSLECYEGARNPVGNVTRPAKSMDACLARIIPIMWPFGYPAKDSRRHDDLVELTELNAMPRFTEEDVFGRPAATEAALNTSLVPAGVASAIPTAPAPTTTVGQAVVQKLEVITDLLGEFVNNYPTEPYDPVTQSEIAIAEALDAAIVHEIGEREALLAEKPRSRMRKIEIPLTTLINRTVHRHTEEVAMKVVIVACALSRLGGEASAIGVISFPQGQNYCMKASPETMRRLSTCLQTHVLPLMRGAVAVAASNSNAAPPIATETQLIRELMANECEFASPRDDDVWYSAGLARNAGLDTVPKDGHRNSYVHKLVVSAALYRRTNAQIGPD